MGRPTSVSIWAVVGLAFGWFLQLVLLASMFAGTDLSLFFGQALVIGIVDVTLSFCAAVFTDSIFSFVVGYTFPFLLAAVINTLSLLSIRGIFFWWGFATAVFLIGFIGGLGGRKFRKRSDRRTAHK